MRRSQLNRNKKPTTDFSVASGASLFQSLDDLSGRVKTMMDMLPVNNREDRNRNTNANDNENHRRWARRVARRVRREELLNENHDSDGVSRSPDRLLKMLERAEAISSAVHSDLQRLGTNVHANENSLRRIRDAQSALNNDVYETIDHHMNDEESERANLSDGHVNSILDSQEIIQDRVRAFQDVHAEFTAAQAHHRNNHHDSHDLRPYLNSVLNSNDDPTPNRRVLRNDLPRHSVHDGRSGLRSYLSNVLMGNVNGSYNNRQYEQNHRRIREFKGVSENQLKMFPVWVKRPPLLTVQSDTEETQMCAICMDSLKVGDSILGLPGCSHMYHDHCIMRWFKQSCLCPLCKQDVRDGLLLRPKRSYNPHK